MGNETELMMRFKVADDGSVTLSKIGKNIESTAGHVDNMNRSLSIIKWDAIVNLGERAFRTAQQVYNLTKEVAASGDEIERQAKVLNMSTTELQQWRYVAYRSDVEVTQLATGIKLLSRNMLEAAEGSKEGVRKFEILGVGISDQQGKLKSYDAMLGEIAERFSQMEDGPKKVAMSLEIFGRSGESMIPLLNKGREGIEELREEFERLGIAIDPETIRKLAKADEEFEKLEARWKTLKTKALAPLVEDISKYLDLITRVSSGESLTGAISKSVGNREAYLKAKENLGKITEEEQKELTGIQAKVPKGIVDWVAQYEPKKMAEGLGMSKEAAEGLAKALEKAAEAEAKMNAMFPDDAETMKQISREAENRIKAMDIMAGLGIKTEIGARREIEAVEEKFKSLMGQGFKPEEMEKARGKLEEELKAVGEKYKTVSGWKEVGEEGGVRWLSNVPMDEMTRNVSEMVEKSIKELDRMQKVAEGITGPKTIMIDYTPVQNANQAVEELRKKLDDINNQVVTITIKQRVEAENPAMIEQLEDALVTRIGNKQSRLGSIIRKEAEGVVYFSNE